MRVTPRNAALANGALAHAHDFDDTNDSMRGHPSAPVVPAIFALGDAIGADGPTLVTAYVVGVQENSCFELSGFWKAVVVDRRSTLFHSK